MKRVALARLSPVVCLSVAVALAAGCAKEPSGPAPSSRAAGKTENKGGGTATPPTAAGGAVDKEASAPAPPAKAVPVELKAVKSSDLRAAIKAEKGKIVVVDFWATWCVPCKKEFPHLVELQRAHGKDGVVCMSVSLDEELDREAALKFLREQQAAFPNFLLAEEQEDWQKNWQIKGIPVVYVFGRDGERVKKFDNDDPDNNFTYADVNRLVTELLRGKK